MQEDIFVESLTMQKNMPRYVTDYFFSYENLYGLKDLENFSAEYFNVT